MLDAAEAIPPQGDSRPLTIGVSAVLLDTREGYRKAGIGRYVLRMLDGLARRQDPHTYHVFVPKGAELEPHWRDSRLRFHTVPFHNRVGRVWWEFAHPRRLARDLGLDVWFSLATGLPAKFPGRRAVMIHDLVPLLYPGFFRRRKAAYQVLALNYACRRSDLVLTNSEATKADIERRFPHRRGKIVVTPLGPGNVGRPLFPDEVSDDDLREIGVPEGPFLFTLGTLEPRKNLGTLFAAMAELSSHEATGDLRLVVAGARGWRESGIVANLEALGIEDRVTFLGYVPDEDLPKLFARCEAFVFPSLYEGFGIPVLEAMLLGAPVLSSDHPAMVEVGGDAARYFNPSDAGAIARAVREFREKGERDAMVAQGFARAPRFDWDATVGATVLALEELAK
ncbi:MAG: glycosyltransferase family 4 protein [Fimbriimonadaceae bacterium]|nr:glycosyltransferase family 4 protein [Fimbriimonadaceae bacterium]